MLLLRFESLKISVHFIAGFDLNQVPREAFPSRKFFITANFFNSLLMFFNNFYFVCTTLLDNKPDNLRRCFKVQWIKMFPCYAGQDLKVSRESVLTLKKKFLFVKGCTLWKQVEWPFVSCVRYNLFKRLNELKNLFSSS